MYSLRYLFVKQIYFNISEKTSVGPLAANIKIDIKSDTNENWIIVAFQM